MQEGLDFERPSPRKSCSRVHAVHILQNRHIPNKNRDMEAKQDQKASPMKDFHDLGGLWGVSFFCTPHERPTCAPRAPHERPKSGTGPQGSRGHTPAQRGTLTVAGRNGRATPWYNEGRLPGRAGTEGLHPGTRGPVYRCGPERKGPLGAIYE